MYWETICYIILASFKLTYNYRLIQFFVLQRNIEIQSKVSRIKGNINNLEKCKGRYNICESERETHG